MHGTGKATSETQLRPSQAFRYPNAHLNARAPTHSTNAGGARAPACGAGGLPVSAGGGLLLQPDYQVCQFSKPDSALSPQGSWDHRAELQSCAAALWHGQTLLQFNAVHEEQLAAHEYDSLVLLRCATECDVCERTAVEWAIECLQLCACAKRVKQEKNVGVTTSSHVGNTTLLPATDRLQATPSIRGLLHPYSISQHQQPARILASDPWRTPPGAPRPAVAAAGVGSAPPGAAGPRCGRAGARRPRHRASSQP